MSEIKEPVAQETHTITEAEMPKQNHDVVTTEVDASAEVASDSTGPVDEEPAVSETEAKAEVAPQTDLELLFSLRDRRQNGTFPVDSYSFRKLKELKNFMNNKVKFKGVQQAYYIFIALMDIETVIGAYEQAAGIGGKGIPGDQYDVERTFDLRGVTLEIIDIFTRNHEASGMKDAKTFMDWALPLNNALGKVQQTDQIIKKLEEKIKAEDEAKNAVTGGPISNQG